MVVKKFFFLLSLFLILFEKVCRSQRIVNAVGKFVAAEVICFILFEKI